MPTLGFHYFPDDLHYRAVDLQAWLPELRALGARWLTLIGSPTRAVPEPFIKRLREAGIEPIVHLPGLPARPDDLEGLFTTYARWGVRYVCVFAEPNTRAAWPAAAWAQTGLVERFLDVMVPIWMAQHAAGLPPVFPPLRAGGDYWDTAFLEAALAGLQRRQQTDLLRAMVFAVNLWTFNRPVDWGAGGLRAWPAAKPYLTPAGSQDQRGFYLFDWMTEIIQARVGEARPLLCLAAGARPGDQADPQLPPVDDLRHATCTNAIVQLLTAGKLPAHLLNVNFWLLAAAEASPYTAEAWYRGDGTTLAAVDIVKRAATPAQRPAAAKQPVPPAAAKPLRHYVLLPTFEWGVSEWHWRAVLDYMKSHRPACGFSPEEAAQAERVTIFGNQQGVAAEVEAALQRAGCVVERVLPPAEQA